MGAEELQSAWELLKEAYQYQMGGDYEMAVELYKRSLDLYPTAEAFTFLGWTYRFLGKIDDAIDMLLDLGVDGITPMDPSGIDYRDYKKRYGDRLTMFGNIDITWPLVEGTTADVERDVREHAEVLKPGGRWIAGSSHSIVNYIPYENFVSMINSFHKYGTY